MTRHEQLTTMYDRAFELGCLLPNSQGCKYLSIAMRISYWLIENSHR